MADLETGNAQPLTSMGEEDEVPVYQDTTFSETANLNPSGPNETIIITSSSSTKRKSNEDQTTFFTSLITGNFLRIKKNKSDSTKNLYAATANNVTFSYGRGKNAVNALNGITLKVPLGTM